MTNIIVFNDKENKLIQEVIDIIKNKKPEEAEYITKRVNSLEDLAKTVSSYPSFQKTMKIGNSTFSIDTLIDLICRIDFVDQIMYLPTKVILGRSFVVAKINFLLMLKYEAESIRKLKKYIGPIEEFVTMNIFAMMSEEVYLSLIQQKDIDIEIRTRAAVHLMNIWEYRLTQSAEEFAPILSSLWQSRKKMKPIYGTMMGTIEIFQIAKGIDPIWFDFIGDSENDDSVFQALEEFIFNLTYEELCSIRKIMSEKNIGSISKEKIESLLHIDNFYSTFKEADPREMLSFYKQRKKNTIYRMRSKLPGPYKTIEEHILLFMLKKEVKKKPSL